MAEDVGTLYMRLGLNLSELETGFVAASRTVNENVRRLNRESDLIRIRSQVEITGLDEAADAERIMQIRTTALNQQMTIQRDRVRILTAELQSLTAAHGADAVATQRAAIRLERERLALAQLGRELRGLNDTQNETNNTFDELNNMLPSMPTRLQAVGMAFGMVTAGVGAAATATKELLEEFRELQNQSYELNLPVNEAKQLLRELKLAGGDIGDYEGFIRGITDAYVKGEYDDPEFIALRRYGAEITDATGKLKNFAEISEEVFKAWEKADEAGEGIEFLQLTGGEAGVRDAIQLFKRLKEAREDAAKIYDANIDADQLHDLDRAFALVEEQAKELKNALGNIFVPAAQAAAENLFNTLHDGTAWLVENKDAIQKWGFIADEVFSTVADKVKKGYTAIGEFIEEATKLENTTDNEKVDKIMSGLDWRYGSAQIPYGVDKMVSGMTEATESYGVFNEAVSRAEKKQQEFNENLQTSIKSWADFRREVEETESKLKEGDGNPLSQYGWQRVQQFRDELDELRAELDNWGNDYETALAQAKLWRDQELTQKNYVSTAEREAIAELYSAKLDQIKQERTDKLEEIRKSADAEFKTSLENRIDKINEEKDAWISAGMEEAEATELAQKRIADIMKKADEGIITAIQSLHQTALEQRLFQIDKEREAWIDKCNDEVQATKWAEQAKVDAQRQSAMSVIKQQAEEFESFQKGGYEGLQAYKYAKLAEQGVPLQYLNMTPEQLQQFQRANRVAENSLMPNFMTEEDKAERQQLIDESKAFRQTLADKYDEKNYVIVDGKKIGMNQSLYGENAPTKFTVGKAEFDISDSGAKQIVGDYDKNGKTTSQIERRFDYDEQGHLIGGRESQADYKYEKGYTHTDISERDYFPDKDTLAQGFSDLSQAGQGATESFSGLPPAVQGVTESLNELPIVVQGISKSLSDITAQFEEIVNPFTNIELEIASVIQQFSGMNLSVEEVTVKLNDLNTAIANLSRDCAPISEQKTPVNVNVTVSIQEAHAWDSKHIQELSDRVADEIKPAIVSAIGGDYNSY